MGTAMISCHFNYPERPNYPFTKEYEYTLDYNIKALEFKVYIPYLRGIGLSG